MQHLPRRYHRSAFLFSIRPLPLRNPCVPDFDLHAQTLEERLVLSDLASGTIGDALDVLSSAGNNGAEWCYRFALKQIIFGYSLSHGWTFWGHFEQDEKPRYLFRSLLESCCFEFCANFEAATYGALDFRITRVDRMDQSHETGEPDYEPRLSTFSELKGLLERQPPSAGREAKFDSLMQMESKGDLSNNVRSLSRDARRAMVARYKSLYGQRVLLDDRGNQLNGAIDDILSGKKPTRRGSGGQPDKEFIVLEAFFTWLLCGEFHEALTKKMVINCIIETAKELSQSDILGAAVGYRRVERFLDERRYWVSGKWKPENWQDPFEKWKTQLP